MTASAHPEPVRSDDPRDLRAIVCDGAFFSVMVGLGETYVPAFALAVGLGELVAGLIATLPMLAGALFQLVTPWAVRRLRSYRRWVVACACLQAASFVPLVVGAAMGEIGLLWLGVATVGYWGFGMATGPAWNAWVTSLVGEGARSEFFAHRTRVAQVALFFSVMAGGLLLELGRARDGAMVLFAVLFTGAMISRLVSASFLSRQSEAPHIAERHRALRFVETVAAVRRARSGRLLAYLVMMQLMVNVAAPFFTPFMLGPLGFSYVEFMTITAVAFLARVLILPALGRRAQRRGARHLLWWGAIAIVPLPALWLLSQNFAYLLALQIVSGCAWAALELATLLSFFEGIEESERTSILVLYNLCTAIAVAVGALAGSQIFTWLAGAGGAYAWIFVVSSVGRLAMLAILRGAAHATGPAHAVQAELRTLAIRPSAGSLDRPILASLQSAPAREEDSTP